MKFHVLTLFPEMVCQGLKTSVIGRAIDRQLIELNTVDIRDFSREKHGSVDDYPYGGGAGMLMQAQPVFDAWKSVCGGAGNAWDGGAADIGAVREGRRLRTVYVTPQGEPFTQRKAEELAREEELIILCGHYEGIDERVLEETVTDYISIGDYVLTGGELAAMVIVDAVGRLVPGVLGNETSAEAESFHGDLLEYPQYSRPEVWHGKRVPEVLLSGNHSRVAQWRLERSKERTAATRPDLYRRYEEKQALIKSLSKEKRNHIHIMESLGRGSGEILYRQGDQLMVFDRAASVCMLLCGDEGQLGEMLKLAPGQTKRFAVNQAKLAENMAAGGFRIREICSQYLYTQREMLPVKHRDIRRLTQGDLSYLFEHCPQDTEEYLLGRVQAGVMYGAFAGGRLIGFAGTGDGGSMDMLYVEEQYRRQGIGEALLSYNINRTLEKGRVPYSHVREDDGASERLQEKLGLYKADRPIWWLEHD